MIVVVGPDRLVANPQFVGTRPGLCTEAGLLAMNRRSTHDGRFAVIGRMTLNSVPHFGPHETEIWPP